jgi:5-methylcytosine-specific restriction endonuclease McrA
MWYCKFVANYATEQMRVYQNERRARLRAELAAMLGGRCAQCDATEDLDFDHIDPTTKRFAIASGLDRPRAELLAELAKCQLLCFPHHVAKTRTEPHPNRARGERTATAKLTEADVLTIRASRVGTVALARQYGVSRHTITNVRSRKTWTHI